jgi:hypothetical protein
MKYAIFALALLVLMHSVLAFAGEVDVTPELGYYAPLNNQVDEGDGAVTATHASALGFGVDDYLYTAQWEVGDFVTEEIFQHDLVWTAGVTIRTGLE